MASKFSRSLVPLPPLLFALLIVQEVSRPFRVCVLERTGPSNSAEGDLPIDQRTYWVGIAIKVAFPSMVPLAYQAIPSPLSMVQEIVLVKLGGLVPRLLKKPCRMRFPVSF